MMIPPRAIRVEACSLCQLHCPLCPAERGETEALIGKGCLKLADFRRLLEQNPRIRAVELGNFGEVFLNPELPLLLEWAHKNGVVTSIDEGANLNHASAEALEALVKYGVSQVRCAIDGVTRESYRQYRRGGDLANVLANVRRINEYKERYGSARPRLIFQFVVFAHNEHEMERAVLLAKILKTELQFKLNFSPNAPVRNRERVRRHLGYADREEYLQAEGRHYFRGQCHEMWVRPQINWDGKLLGCSRNIWGAYADDVFSGNLIDSINNASMQYARQMLMGAQSADSSIPCSRCSLYRSLAEYDDWITPEEIEQARTAVDALYGKEIYGTDGGGKMGA